MLPLDTSAEAADVQVAVLQRMGPELRLRAGLDLTELSRRLLIQGIRSRNPDYTDEQVRLAMISEWLGEQDFVRAFGGISAPTP